MSDDKLILYGGPDPKNIIDNKNSLGDFILARLDKYSEKIALVDGVTSIEMTYAELRAKSIRYAECLQHEGIKEGDVIGLCSENRLDYPCALFAAFYLGATVAPLNLTYAESELHHAINLSRPKLIFTSPYVIDKVAAVAKENSFIRKVVVFSDESPINEVQASKEFLDNPKVKSNKYFHATPVNIHKNVALVLCSSGTTGLPKGVQLTQYNVLVSTSHVSLEGNFFKLNMPVEELVILKIIPWFHAYGVTILIGMTMNGTKLVCLPKFEENLFLSCIETHKVSFIFIVPPLMVFLAKHPLVDQYDLSSLKEVICGAAPLSKEIEQAVYQRIKSMKIIRQGYGMSEMTLSTLLQMDIRKPGSVGCLRPGTWCKVVDPDTGKLCGPNQSGELWFAGSQIMKGYIGNDNATMETIDKDGWLHTGDIGYFDEDEQFYIVDRLKELIKYKGYQVPPAELEALLLSNPKIKDAAVIGKPDELSGELPLAFVVKQPNVDVTAEEIMDFVASKTSPAKRLHGGVRFVDEILKNASGKILRRHLRDMLKKETTKSKL